MVHADRIVVLRKGKIRESGTHGEMAAGGSYASLVRQQMGGFPADRRIALALG